MPQLTPATYRLLFFVLLLLIAVFGFSTIYFYFQSDKITTPSMAAGLGVTVSAFQWLVSQLREVSRSSWEAVNDYYSTSDGDEIREIRDRIKKGDFSNEDAAVFCNFYEKWGRLARMSYLPVYVFDGPSGVGISNSAIKLQQFLTEQRMRNERYAESYLWLLKKLLDKGYLKNSDAESKLPDMLRNLSAR